MAKEIKNINPTIKEMTLLLLWLTKFTDERNPQDTRFRSWKGYDFGALDELLDESLIEGSYKAKSVVLTDAGIKMARELQQKYGIA